MNNISESQRLHYQIDAIKEVTNALFGSSIAKPKKKAYDEDFSMFIGDVEFSCKGDYESDDPSVGYSGQFTLTRVWVATDLQASDLTDYLSKKVIETIEQEGYKVMSERATEEAADEAEYSRDMER